MSANLLQWLQQMRAIVASGSARGKWLPMRVRFPPPQCPIGIHVRGHQVQRSLQWLMVSAISKHLRGVHGSIEVVGAEIWHDKHCSMEEVLQCNSALGVIWQSIKPYLNGDLMI